MPGWTNGDAERVNPGHFRDEQVFLIQFVEVAGGKLALDAETMEGDANPFQQAIDFALQIVKRPPILLPPKDRHANLTL